MDDAGMSACNDGFNKTFAKGKAIDKNAIGGRQHQVSATRLC